MQVRQFAYSIADIVQNDNAALRRASNRDLVLLSAVLQAIVGWIEAEMKRRKM